MGFLETWQSTQFSLMFFAIQIDLFVLNERNEELCSFQFGLLFSDYSVDYIFSFFWIWTLHSEVFIIVWFLIFCKWSGDNFWFFVGILLAIGSIILKENYVKLLPNKQSSKCCLPFFFMNGLWFFLNSPQEMIEVLWNNLSIIFFVFCGFFYS